ncbi:class I SAM-dependent methyltransferase [Laceyella putida]|uniref:Class I SAM-dependent methyltransferase n=1 Tax=Laceyella putida TaxID=110101 RepID=A0ABW2RKL3_9BACL
MTHFFHDRQHRHTYASRSADSAWLQQMSQLIDWEGKTVADIGCGGGIYSKAMLELQAACVIGIDYSSEMLKAANEKNPDPRIRYQMGEATQTGLADNEVDIVFSRALIHHLTDLPSFLQEAKRIIKPGGFIIVQNRTPDDCFLPGSEFHIRGYLFQKFPHLKEIERRRRYTDLEVKSDLIQSGFLSVKSTTVWEVRRTYQTLSELAKEMSGRIGRSILHHLSDDELHELVQYITDELRHLKLETIVEQDRWTVWTAKKPLTI